MGVTGVLFTKSNVDSAALETCKHYHMNTESETSFQYFLPVVTLLSLYRWVPLWQLLVICIIHAD